MKQENPNFNEFSGFVMEERKHHEETKQELKKVNDRLDKMDGRLDRMDTDLRIIKNLLLQMVENNGLKAVK